MKKIIHLLMTVLLGIALSACSTLTYPVTDAKLKEDITSYLKLSPSFSEIISIEMNSKTLTQDLFTVNASIEYKSETALVNADLVVEYYKSESAWVRKSPVLTILSAVATVEPDDTTILASAVGLNRSGIENKFDFNYWFDDFSISDKTVTLSQNKVLYEITSEQTSLNCTASLTLGVDTRYTYEEGWKAIAIPFEKFKETTTWDGRYQILLGEPILGISSFPITLSGTIEVTMDAQTTRVDGSVTASFTFDGVDYEVEGGNWTTDNDTPTGRILVFYYDQPNGKYLFISLMWAGHETEPYLTYGVNFNGVIGTLKVIE